MKIKKAVWLLLILMAVCFVVPRPTTFAPTTTVEAVDDHGVPFVHTHASNYRQDYATSFASSEQTTEVFTDQTGRATFVGLSGQSSPGLRFLHCLGQVAKFGAHASCGVYDDFHVDAPGYHEVDRKQTHTKDTATFRIVLAKGSWLHG